MRWPTGTRKPSKKRARHACPAAWTSCFSSPPRARATAWRCTRWPSCRARWPRTRPARRCACWTCTRATRPANTPAAPAMATPARWRAASLTGCPPPAPPPCSSPRLGMRPPCAAWRCSTASAPTTCRKSWCAGPTWWWPTTTTTTTAPPCSTPSRSSRAGAWPCWWTRPTTCWSARAACTPRRSRPSSWPPHARPPPAP